MDVPLHYSLVIQWSDEDQAFLVTVPELPGFKTHGETYVEAVEHAQEALKVWIEGETARGRPIPQPHTLAAAS
jgi:predicted RNase H-like HicB family nuclease